MPRAIATAAPPRCARESRYERSARATSATQTTTSRSAEGPCTSPSLPHQIEARPENDPHDVDQVPIQCPELDRRVVDGRIESSPAADGQCPQHDRTGEHV